MFSLPHVRHWYLIFSLSSFHFTHHLLLCHYLIIYQPKKKPRGGQLDLCDRFLNAVIASARITVENIICGIKRCRILKDTFRNHLAGFDDQVMEIACGLYNLRVRHRHSFEQFNLFDFIS
ncbi:MAG: hypothetical protein H6633_29165 [Anaerolineales bacterium]|nr:hypothetical protein [Anaerolineales bacterium]